MIALISKSVVTARTAAWPVTNARLLTAGSCIFIVANMLLATALTPVAGTIVFAASIAACVFLYRFDRLGAGHLLSAHVDWRFLGGCIALSLGLCILGGQGHFFHSSEDWLIRDAVLGDVAKHGVTPTYLHDGVTYALRAPLGMYLIPGFAGRSLGVGAAHAVLIAQNTVLLALVLYFPAMLAGQRRAAFLALFIGFSGLDAIPVAMITWLESGYVGLLPHIEHWSPFARYMSHITGLFWAPNHLLPGLWFAALTVLRVRDELTTPQLLIPVAALALWSSLAMIGAAVIVAFFAIREWRALVGSRAWWSACAIGTGFLPVAIYLQMDTGGVSRGWQFFRPGFGFNYIWFIAAEIPHLLLLENRWRTIDARFKPLLLVAAGVLLLLPLYTLGPNNDFTMRVSIVPLALLAFVFATTVLAFDASTDRRLKIFAMALIAVGALTPAMEVRRTLMLKPFAISPCNLLTAWHSFDPATWMSNYMARVDRMPDWLMRVDRAQPPLKVESMTCWPDHPVTELPMDVRDPRYRFP